jgi:large subunit ribosomal protein L4
MQVPVLDINGKQVKTIELPADIFEVEVNVGLMHQAYTRQMANRRLGTHKVQRRADVSRTTAKMYKQKGTGRARHGSRSATQFVGGGRPMGPQPRDYTLDMPKKMRRQGAADCAAITSSSLSMRCPSKTRRRRKPSASSMRWPANRASWCS